jgi:hypothetical protein
LAAPVFVLQATLQAPQLVIDEVDDSQPLVFGACVRQSRNPEAQPVYAQAPLAQLAPALCAVSQATPQSPQFVVVVTAVSHPLVSGGVGLQSLKPALQLEYWQMGAADVSQVVKLLCAVSQAPPQALQEFDWATDSQPSVSGASDMQST